MRPSDIQAAIVYGSSRKAVPRYVIRKGGFFGSVYKPVLGVFTTPFLRVAQAAFEAKKQYKVFSAADVSREMLAPVLLVYGFSPADGARIASVQSIIVTPKGRHEPETAIRPDSSKEVPVEFRNQMG